MSKSKQKTPKGFKLERLTVINHKILKNNIFEFIDHEDDFNNLYTTIIIGPNGTGKSEIFKLLLQLFRAIYLHSKKGKNYEAFFFYSLIYWNEGIQYEFTNIKEKVNIVEFEKNKEKYPSGIIKIDGVEAATFQIDNIMPKAVIAQASMLKDKYIFMRQKALDDSFPQYRYLGVRTTAQQASTRGYVRKTVQFIVEKMSSDVFRDGIQRMTKFLEFNDSIIVSYKTVNTKIFFEGDLTKESFHKFYQDIKTKYENSNIAPPFKLNNYQSISKDSSLIDDLIKFINGLKSNNKLDDIYRSSAKHLNYDITAQVEYHELGRDYKNLETLRRLGILKAPEIKLAKRGIGLEDTSSGEFHFFSSMVGFMATVKPNSLIFIDEPEISLHPNWQMKYLAFIRELFGNNDKKSSHFIIATHSHFFVSDLPGESATIIGLNFDSDNKIKAEKLEKNTFGWSAEDVLYNIFNVRSSLNYYLEADLTELLGLIAMNSKEKLRLQKILDKLVKLPERKNDPLQEIIGEAKNYINKLQ
ncbi:AAA family ATPase [Xanthomarina sp. F2636L]|uniref:AAA family ATPase n=1 Tax=Xanthomarina sp. F2636L TaxID=2996018 RepID=UPI00225E0EAD|nr:AAA family ATPase [Xanthomarina sp. F2636L]MCX7552119.1 AAA family ATPase [Xanthomarina sp. F2636L]